MIKICSFFDLPIEEERIGPVYSIANSYPRNVRGVTGKLFFFVPSWSAVAQYKKDHDEEAFIEAYREHVKAHGGEIKKWLNTLTPGAELYLCCWEREGFCHRQLVAKLIRKLRPDLKVRLT